MIDRGCDGAAASAELLHARSLGDVILRDGHLDRLALLDLGAEERAFSFRMIDRAAEAAGQFLLDRGLRRGQRVAIVSENNAEFLFFYLGALRAGLVAVPINYRLPATMVAYILEDCGAKVALVDEGRELLVSDHFPRLRIEEPELRMAIGQARGEPLDFCAETDEMAQILYTSGSTGRPKGVPLSHRGQLWALSMHAASTPMIGERTLVTAPMYHMNALFNLSVALMNKVEVLLMPRFDARAWLQAIADHRCTMLSGIPSMFAMAARERDLIETLNFKSVHHVSIGSAPLTDALVERVRAIFGNAVVTNGYGTTEAGPSIFGEHPDGLPRPTLSVGYPLRQVQWRLADGSETEGVLEIQTPALLRGYLNLPEVTAQRLKDGWFSTGDIMRQDESGFFYFVGRSDDMFVCGGENVYPGEIEKLIERHSDIMQAAVVAVPDEIKGQIPIAFVVPVPGRNPAPEEVKAFSLREGPAFSHPRAVIVLDRLPVASTHKLDRACLVERALAVAKSLGR